MPNLKIYNRSIVENFRLWYSANFQFFIRLYLRFLWSPKNKIEETIHLFSRSNSEFRFIQIGANDGLTNDPIFKFIIANNWSGIRIEPLSIPFKKLQKLHKSNKRIKLLNCLAGDQNGSQVLYQLSFSSSRWATGIASLNRDALQKQIDIGYVAKRAAKNNESLPQNPDEWITSKEIPMMELNSLIETGFKKAPDLLQIDTEGYDLVLINHLNLEKHVPAMICFEKAHASESELEDCLARLTKFGYQFVSSNMDILAFQSKSPK